jgi:anti-sigma-K factor RskA
LNTEEYISSGILESYVLGITTDKENAEVEQYASQYPEIATEIQIIRESLENFALSFEKEPPAGLRDKILDNLIALNEVSSEETLKTIPLQSKGNTTTLRWLTPWMAAASVVLLIASLVVNFMLYNSLQNTRERLASLENQNQQISQVLETSQRNSQELQHEIDMFKDPGMKMIMLKGTKADGVMAVVAWKIDNNQVFIVSPKLPPPPENMQYQLWAIVDGHPIDAGMLENTDKVQSLKIIKEADLFAITLEKKGGNPTPEGEMYAKGNV